MSEYIYIYISKACFKTTKLYRHHATSMSNVTNIRLLPLLIHKLGKLIMNNRGNLFLLLNIVTT